MSSSEVSTFSIDVPTLYQACKEKNSDVVESLLKDGRNVDELVTVAGEEWTPLMRASCDGNGDLVEFLLKFGAKVDLQASNGCTALMVASMKGHSRVIQLLHEYGAQVDLTDDDGWTALMYASQNGHYGVVVYCLRAVQRCAVHAAMLLKE